MKLGIFTAFRNLHKNYIRSCEELGIDYEIVDIISPNWMENVQKSGCDGFLCRPPSKFEERNRMFDERLYFVNKEMKYPIYPSYEELLIYENKRFTSYWLKLNGFPHPETNVFYNKKSFLNFISMTKLPIVIKLNTGSTAKGVKIVRSKAQAKFIANLTFGLKNDKLAIGYTPQKTGKIFPFPAIGTIQRHHLIVQEYKDIKWEWRMVKIGESYFGHKKLKIGEFASGTKLKGWEVPPVELLNLTKDICTKGKFNSMNIDIFETSEGQFLVNELQSLFGQSTKYLMYVDGKPGRFIDINGKFEFEEGNFNQYESYLLRVKHFIELLKELKGQNCEN